MFEAEASAIVREFEAGATPAGVALMRIVMASRAPEDVARALAGAAELSALWRAHPEFWALAKALQATVDHRERAQESPTQRARRIAAAFDRAAALSPDAACALYALGDPRATAEATAEVVEWLVTRGFLPDAARVLDIGCGAGRFEVALAPRAARILALETSAGMAAAARSRCASVAGVEIALCEYGAPPALAPASFDLALAVDSFPYVVQAGGDFAQGWFAAVAGALAPGGRLAILNYSYRGDFEADAREAAQRARDAGLVAVLVEPRPFRRWDGAALGFARL